MILLTELSTRIQPPALIADEQGVWKFSFNGDATYTDDNGVTLFWPIQPSVNEIRGVTLGTINYLEVSSLSAVRSTPESFFWDAPTLYIHHTNNENDYVIGTAVYRLLEASAGFATGRYPGQSSYYSGQFYDPRITNIGRLTKRVDPLKFGLLSFESSSYDLANADGDQDNISNGEVLNSQVRFIIMPEGAADLTAGTRIFTGYTGGAQRSDSSLSVTLQEARTFFDREVCPNTFNTTDYPSIDSKFDGKRIPVAYGKIRRGIAVPIDTASFDKATGGVVTFKLADESLHALTAVTALYDDNDNEVTIGTTNLTACTVTYDVPAGADLNLSRFSWEGQGYAIPGTYNNGLDIIKDAFVEQADLPFGADTFDTAEWAAQTSANTQSVGLSVQSDRGIIEEIVEPITVSLQGIVDVLGDGRITFRPRDPDAPAVRSFRQDELLQTDVTFDINADDVVSSVVVEYAPSAVDRDDTLQAAYTDEESAVTARYGLKKAATVTTALTEEADAIAVGVEVMSTSADPQETVSIVTVLDTNPVQLFDIVQVDVGRPGVSDWRVYEVLERSVGLQNGELVSELVLRRLVDRVAVFVPVTNFDEGLYSEVATLTWDGGSFSNDLIDTYYDEGEIA